MNSLCRATKSCALVLFGLPLLASAQATSDAATILLAHSEVEEILGGFRGAIESELSSLGVDLSTQLVTALDQTLSPSALMPIMRARFEAQGRPDLMTAAADLAEGGAISRVESTAEALPPSTTLEEYAASLETAPPSQQRIQLVAQVAAAQAAGDFFVLLAERFREAAHVIAGSEFEPISEQLWQQQAQQALLGAVVSFLHRYENVSDADLQGALTEWTSDAGAWYVQAYSFALAETALEAAALVAERARQ